MGVSARWVQVMAKKGGYSNVRVQANSRGRDIYLIPLSSLPDAAQQKYFAEHAPAALTAVAPVKAKRLTGPPPANRWKPILPRNAVKLGTG